MIKRGLGRGLGALLSSTPTESEGEESLIEVPIDQIEVNPNQPRKIFDFTALDELAASIRASGVIQPIIVRRFGVGYQLIAGERRWRAARQAGLDRIPAIVRDATDAQSIEIALVENLLREDLNPIETAQAYQKLLAEFGWTQEELAQRIGKDRTSIANSLRMLKLPEEIQADLRNGRLTMGHARALLAVMSTAEQFRLRDQILANDWSVRTTEDSIRATETSPWSESVGSANSSGTCRTCTALSRLHSPRSGVTASEQTRMIAVSIGRIPRCIALVRSDGTVVDEKRLLHRI